MTASQHSSKATVTTPQISINVTSPVVVPPTQDVSVLVTQEVTYSHRVDTPAVTTVQRELEPVRAITRTPSSLVVSHRTNGDLLDDFEDEDEPQRGGTNNSYEEASISQCLVIVTGVVLPASPHDQRRVSWWFRVAEATRQHS